MTREIIVNGRFLSRRVTGVERYGREILCCFPGKHRIEKPAMSLVEMTSLNNLAGHAWEQFILPTRLNRFSMLWSPANIGPIFVRNQALTIHDLSPLEHPEWFQSAFALWYRLLLPLLIKRVRIVFTPSEYVKQQVERRFGIRQVIVTPNGVDTTIFHPGAQPQTIELPTSYILFVGTLQPRKNLNGLLDAWQKVKDDFKNMWLVIAGEAGRVFKPIGMSRVERVRFVNYISDDDLPALYAHANLFVLPAFDEGFGLPILEAMACGVPVLVSNGGALPEVAGDAGMVFDLSKPDELANSIRMILSEKVLQKALQEKALCRAKTFSWQATAELIWKSLNES